MTLTTASYASDADGNTLSRPGQGDLSWDSQNRLAGAAGHAYTYGADGLRRSDTVTTSQGLPKGPGASSTFFSVRQTDYAYDGQGLVREFADDGQGGLSPSVTYLNGPRGPEYRRDDTQAEGTYKDPATGQTLPANKTRWYVYDGLGSVVAEVDPSGNVTSSGTFDVYGARRAGGTGAASSKQGFVGSLGHVTDSETGLVYMRARYYDPQVGRFVSEDSGASGNNWYIYAGNNPVDNVDSSGNNTISLQQWFSDAGWTAAGWAFTSAAIYFMCGGTVPGFKNAAARANNMAVACTTLAIICFGAGQTGIESGNGVWYTNLLAEVAAAGSAIVMLANMGTAAMSGGVGRGIAGVAIAACITEEIVDLGCLCSVGVDA